jgi:hypothetical protein
MAFIYLSQKWNSLASLPRPPQGTNAMPQRPRRPVLALTIAALTIAALALVTPILADLLLAPAGTPPAAMFSAKTPIAPQAVNDVPLNKL